MAGRWLDVGEAAHELGISTDAVRKRIARGSLRSDRKDGHVWVWLDVGGTEAGREAQVDGEALVEVLQDHISDLRTQLEAEREARRRADTIIAQLTQANAALAAKVPELEAPQTSEDGTQESAEGAVMQSQQAGAGATVPQKRSEGVPWWRRLLGEGR
jgi:hypothetical protein